MTNKATESGEYFEFSKVTCAPLRKTALLIAGAAAFMLLAGYLENDPVSSAFGNTLIVVSYFTLQIWCDLSNINFKNTQRLKTLLSVLSFSLSVIGLVVVALVTKSGRVYDQILWLIN
jgi:hypothetical protein